MARAKVWLNGKEYKLARDDRVPTGARRWAMSSRPSQPSDPSVELQAKWNISGPNLNSIEVMREGEESGYLGVNYTTGVDTRWQDLAILGPAMTSVDCSTGDTISLSGFSTNGVALTGTLNANAKYLYVIRGREPKKVKLSTWTAYDPAINLSEGATSILYTKTDAGTQEISIGMAATAYHVVSAVADDAAADTASANNNSKKGRIIGMAPDRAILLDGQTIQGNILTGSVTMDADAIGVIETLSGWNVTPTGFAVDGDRWVLGYDIGPVVYDNVQDTFYPLMPEAPRSNYNCAQMAPWYPLGVLIPMARGLRYMKNGSGESIGPERFLSNTSPVSGRCTAVAGTDYWLYAAFYDEPNDDTYICVGRPRLPGDPHSNPMSWFVIAKFTDVKVNTLANIHDGDGALTNPAIVGGYNTNIFYTLMGRYFREIDDSNYRFQTSGVLHLTEMRRHPGILKDLVAVELTSAACGTNDTLKLGFTIDGGSLQELTGTTDYGSGATLNGIINTNGRQRVLFVDNSGVPHTWASGYRIRPQITFAANANTASPKVEGQLVLTYRARPVMANTYEFSLELDEHAVWGTVEEQGDQLLTEFGSGPVLMTEDVDNDSYYVRVESVVVREVQERGGSQDRPTGPIRVATIKTTQYPTVAGN